MSEVLLCIAGIAFLGIIAASLWSLIRKRWFEGIINILLVFGCAAATVFVFAFLMPTPIPMFGPAKMDASGTVVVKTAGGMDEFQDIIRKPMAVPGGDVEEFTPKMPLLRRAATDRAKMFQKYIEPSTDWHVFIEQGSSHHG